MYIGLKVLYIKKDVFTGSNFKLCLTFVPESEVRDESKKVPLSINDVMCGSSWLNVTELTSKDHSSLQLKHLASQL